MQRSRWQTLLRSKGCIKKLKKTFLCYRNLRRRSNIIFTPIGISLITFSLAADLPLLKWQHGKTGRNTLQPWINNSLILNLIVCQKTQLNLKRISLLKRKAQLRRKRIQRKKHVKVKTQRARFTAPGFFLRHWWYFSLRLLAPSSPPQQLFFHLSCFRHHPFAFTSQ